MFVIIHNNYVVLGPMRWNRFRFENFLLEELETNFTLESANTDSVVIVSDNIKIMPVETTPNPMYNSKIELLHGPMWEFTDTHAISSYEVWPMNIDAIKYKLKQQASSERYSRSIAKVDVTIEENIYSFPTDADTRNVIQNALLASSNSFNWKIESDTWVTLTNTELQLVLDAITTHVQECFDWEYETINKINECSTAEELDAIVIVEPKTGAI